MPAYTMRITWPDEPDRRDDFIFRADGKDAGRCYFHAMPRGGSGWHWTVYATNANGDEPTLEEAQRRFKEAYEKKERRP